MKDGSYVTVATDVPYSQDFDAMQLLLTNYIPVLSIMHERTLLDEVGGFDPSLPFFEDWDLWIRLSRITPFIHIKQVTCEFTMRHDGSSMTSNSAEHFRRTEHLIFLRYLHFIGENPDAREALYHYQQDYLADLMRSGKSAEALDLLEHLAQKEPDFAPVAFDLATLYRDNDRIADAEAATLRARSNLPGSVITSNINELLL